MMTLILAKCVCVRAQLTHCNIYREDNKVQKATSLCLRFFFSFFPLFFHLPPSLWQQAWSHLSNPTTNTHTHSAGTYTVSELQRHPAVGVGVHFLKLWFPSAYKCNRRTEKLTTLVRCTRKLFMGDMRSRRIFTGTAEQLSHLPQNGASSRSWRGNNRKEWKDERRRQFLPHQINLWAPWD